MKRLLIFIEGLIIILLIFILISVVIGNLTFGYGIGDWYYIILILIVSVVFVITFHAERFRNFRLVIAAIMLVFVIVVILKISVLRGPEMSWDGRFFVGLVNNAPNLPQV